MGILKDSKKNITESLIKNVDDYDVLMITGGTGSFGNSVLERFLLTEVKEIRIFSRDEKKQDDMRKKFQRLITQILYGGCVRL